jgi:glutathione S-transferase
MKRRDYVTVEEAVKLPGLRIAFSHGVPGPWGEAVRCIFDIKGIDYAPVIQEGGAPNEALQAWTGQNSAPVAMLNDERPRAHWSELVLLAERLAPEPRVVPANEDERTAMWGILFELCGEDGFGWSTRLCALDIVDRINAGVSTEGMRRKFTSGASLDHAKSRVRTILAMLARRLEAQRKAGSDYLVGRALSAADIYWTTFSNLLAPMNAADCPMPDYYRNMGPACLSMIGGTVPDILLEHRERTLKRHFQLPMWF